MEERLARGIRNNNPLNIIHSNAVWQGESPTQTDPNFVQFQSMEYGIRAAVLLLRAYKRRGISTIANIVKRWCPDHTAESYIRNVCRLTGMSRNQVIDINHETQVISLLDAMIKVECAGYEVDKDILITGYRLAFGHG